MCARHHQGFTLIELMLVIVIISIFAAMVGLSVGGSQERQLLQQRERLIDQLSLIELESADQGKVLGLQIVAASVAHAEGYQVVTFDPSAVDVGKRWPQVPVLPRQYWPDQVTLHISSLQNQTRIEQQRHQANPLLKDANTPPVLWFGTGEATPAKLQLWYQQQPVGDPVYVTATGRVSVDEHGDK